MSDDVRGPGLGEPKDDPGIPELPLDAHHDPLRDSYREAFSEAPALRRALERSDTALLCIDMQYLDAVRGHGVFADMEASGVPAAWQEYYFDRVENMVVPNMRMLQVAFRNAGLEVIHTRIQSLTRDGRDRSPGHKRLGLHAPPGSKEAQFVEAVAPEPDEIVINKTASGVFNATNLSYVLRNLGVTALYMAGVYTDECVSTAIRDACDLGFFVTLVHDACASPTEERHQAAITNLRDRYARVLSTREAVEELERLRSQHGMQVARDG